VFVCELVESIVGIDIVAADQAAATRLLADLRRVRGWADSVEVAASARLAELARESPSIFPERLAADAGHVSLTEASKGFDRAKTVQEVPELGAALTAGETSGGHVDCRLCVDDGMARLEHQKRATRLRTSTDRDSGMWCLRGEFDPQTGLVLDRKLLTMVDSLFNEKSPETAPVDPVSKQQYLRALALAALCDGKGGRLRTELTVLIDARTLLSGEHADTFVDLGVDIDLPVEAIRRMATSAAVLTPVITAANGVNLHLGRSKRLASRDQRRILRVMYPTCALPGCTVPFDKTEIHHIDWFGPDNGKTDIDDLAPICHTDHRRIHERRVAVSIDRQRNMTLTYPDGTTMTTGPPKRGAG
jgi:hypothetical protein